jgi:hypothetical protein
MESIGLIGGDFQHAFSSTLWKHPISFNWAKNQLKERTFFIDQAIIDNIETNDTEKFGWVVESRVIIPQVINEFKKNYKAISESYKYIFTHHKDLYDLAPNFIYFPPHGYWIENPFLYNKSKIASLISSNKNIGPGHVYRLNWVNRLKDKIDIFGRGIKTINKKEEALCDYMFSVTIENDQYSTYWTEKILDCFVTGTVPIYHGSPDIGDYFNSKGIITLDDNFDPKNLSRDLYESMLPTIKENFEKALKYNVIEDLLYEQHLVR